MGSWIVRRKKVVAGCAILVAMVCIPGMHRLTFTDNIRIFFSSDNPQYKALERVRDIFARSETLFFTLAPQEGDIFQREFLTVLAALTEATEMLPYAANAYSFLGYPVMQGEDNELLLRALVDDPATLTQKDLNALRQKTLENPMLLHHLVAPDGSAASIFVRIPVPAQQDDASPAIVHAALTLRDQFRKEHPDITFHVTGELLFAHNFIWTGIRDLFLLGPPMFLVMCLLIGMVLRSSNAVIATITVMTAAVGSAMGIAGWMGIQLSIISAGAAGLIFTLAVADCIHIVQAVFTYMREGVPRMQAIAKALDVNLRPVFLTSLTTMIGFLSLNTIDSPPFRALGNIIAIGVVAAFFFSITLLPALLATLPLRVGPDQPDAVRAFMRKLALMTQERECLIRTSMLAVSGVAVLGMLHLYVDGHFQEMFSPRMELRRAADFQMRHMQVASSIVHAIPAEENGGVYEPAFMQMIDQFAQWYRQQPGVLHTMAPSDTVKRIHRALHADDPAEERIPDQRDVIAQCLLLYEIGLPAGDSLDGQIDPTRRVAALRVLTERLTVPEWLDLDARARDWLQKHGFDPAQAAGASPDIIWAHVTQQNVRNMYRSKLMVLVIISVILMLALRNPALGLIGMVPNLLPLVITFGIWGYTTGAVGLAVTAVGTMTLGIVVDDTIHMLCRYDASRKKLRLPPYLAMQHVLTNVGASLTITSIALIGGFLILATSPFEMTSILGRMSALVIAIALVYDLLLVPTLLPAMERWGIISLGKETTTNEES